MNNQPLRGVLLDNNGTGFDDLHVAYGSACACLAHWGLPAPTLEQYREEMSSNWEEWYYRYGMPRDVTGAEMNARRRAYYDEHGHTARYRWGVRDCLRFCHQRGLVVAMVSAEVASILAVSLDRENLAHYFDHIEAQAWPKTPALVRTLVRLGIPPGQAVYVDDSVEGITSARTIGMRTIGFTNPTAYASRDRILAAGPETTAKVFEVVVSTLASWL